MPEFQRQKRRSLTDQQLYEEYHQYDRTDEPKRKGSPPKKTKKPPSQKGSQREAPPVSPERRKMQEEQNPAPKREAQPDKTTPPKKASSAKKAASSKKAASAQKESPKNSRTRKKRGKMTLYYVLIGIVVIAAVSILSVTVLFNISGYEVVGDTAYTDEEIIAACGIDIGDNLLRINIGNAEEQIVSKLVYIDSAQISRGFPNRLVIAVEPARPAVSFASGSSFYVISERGRLLEIGPVSADCPVVNGFSPASDSAIGSQLEDDGEGRLSIALQMIGYMGQYGLNRQCEINLTDTLNITMLYDGRVEMELGASTRLEDKFYHASLLLDGEISSAERCTLILSNPDRVVKRPIYDTVPDNPPQDEHPQDELPDDELPEDGEDPESDDDSDDLGE